MIDDWLYGEAKRTSQWVDEQLRLLLPGWHVRLLLRTRWRWLARASGVEIHYYSINRRPPVVVILRWGKVRAVRPNAK